MFCFAGGYPNGNVFSYEMAKNMYDFGNHPVVAVCCRKKLESLGRVFFSTRKKETDIF